ncbi:MAG: head GIN domain-containing protein [Bacteroidota bacterium]
MKKHYLFIIAFFAMISISFAQIKETRVVGNFTAIKASTSVNVVYTQGATQSVLVSWEKDLMKYLKVEAKNNILRIYIDNDNYFKNIDTSKLLVSVTNKGIGSVTVSSSATFSIKNNLNVSLLKINTSSSADFSGTVTCNSIFIDASSSSNVALNMSTQDVAVNLSSSSTVDLKGKTNNLAIDASSSSDCDAKELTSNVAQILASTSSEVNVVALKSLDATASTSASIKYYGKLEKVKLTESTSGSVEQVK